MPSATGLLVILFFLIAVKCSSVNHPSIEDSFRQCLITQPSVTLGHCLGVGAISKLQSLDSHQEFDLIDGVTLSRGQQEYREAYNFADTDPADFRTWIDSLGHVFSHRSLRWDMSFLYPGLAMRVAPSTSPGGQLEFILDPQREILNKHSLKEIGTALLAKKAIIISKIALIISSAYGLGTLLLGNGNRIQQTYPSSSSTSTFNPGFGGGTHYNRFPEEEFPEVLYRGISENNVDQLRLYGNLQKVYNREDKSNTGRNFAWSEDEKEKKSTEQ
ncbi:hypothetical protein BDFB_003543 [Asbolus verrucosus]|uniref:Uncharacterized protein n=1 Tax=Asbolus verrucosus TaxID=1661398 RepID=A0A482VB15_ASBVE|nr:hypothetical protein BDFB_003543 [Asbolus verrucosus]